MVPKCALGKYLLAPTFLDKNFVKFVRKRGGGMLRSDIIIQGGVQILTNADMGGGGVKKLQKYADVICERPLIIIHLILNHTTRNTYHHLLDKIFFLDNIHKNRSFFCDALPNFSELRTF